MKRYANLYRLLCNRYLLPVIISLIVITSICPVAAKESVWEKIDDGLYIGEFEPEHKSIIGNSLITVIRIDPDKYAFSLICASETGDDNMSARQWAEKYGLLGAVNGGMFLTDHKSNVAYMKNYNHNNNSRIHPRYHSVAAFNPVKSVEAEFKIFDIDEEDMSSVIESYHTVIQNLRLIKKPGRNVWSKQDKIWSEAALGEDKDGNVLFIFSRSPYSMYDFNNILLSLPINLVAAQHLEGGPEASLYFRYEDKEIAKVGSYETGFFENEGNSSYWKIPNVIGFRKRTKE